MDREVNNIINRLFTATESSLERQSNEHINSLRKEAMDNFQSFRLPTLKDEDYKYSDVESWLLGALNSSAIVTGDESISLKQYPDGVVVCDINTFAKEYSDIFKKYYTRSVEDNSLMMLTRAFAAKGVVVYVPENVVCDEVISLNLNTAKGDMLLGERNIFIFERGSLAKIDLSRVNNGTNNSVTEIFIEQRANVEFSEELLGDDTSLLIGTLSVNIGRDAFYKHISINRSKGKCRANEVVSLLGNGSEASIYGAVVAGDDAHVDNYTLIKHQVENCRSFEHFKNVARDRAVTVFNGNIYVAAGANATEAYQQNNNILLSDEAAVYTKPNLEIYADDVKCSHGATVGQLSDDALFYMAQRGISSDLAKELLLDGFILEIVDKISTPSIVERLRNSTDKEYEL